MRGEPHYTLSQVASNDVMMVFAFAPLVALLLGLSAISVPWDTLLLSVLLFGFQGQQILAAPLVIALLAVLVVNRSRAWYERLPGVIPYAQCCRGGAAAADPG